MSGVDIARSLQLVLQSACPDANVVIGIPKQIHDSVVIYFWDGDGDDVTKTTNTIRRHHPMQVHLLVQSTADDVNAELLTYDLRERIKSVFQVNRRLLGSAVNSTLTKKNLGSQYVLVDQAEYRASAYVWDAEEQLTFVFA